MPTMKAAVVRNFGKPLAIEDVRCRSLVPAKCWSR
jgi:hypothetical protein